MVRRIVRVGALFAAFAIAVASCSDDEEPARDDGSSSGAGGESGEASGVGGTGGRGGGGAGSGGTGGDPSGTGGSGAALGGASGTSGAGGNGAESGGGAAGRGSTVECSNDIQALANEPCANPGEICEINEQCCCGQCEPEVRCRCNAGTWECEYIDLCLDPMCGGAGGTGGEGT